MKSISLSMSENFKVTMLFRNNVYELENNSTLFKIDCKVDDDLTYKLHISHGGNKHFVVMDKGEGYISALLSAPLISSNGVYYVQIEGIKADYRIISNQIRLELGSFINAEHIPTPEEQSVIDEILIRVNTLGREIESEANIRESSYSYLQSQVDNVVADKQDKLVSGINIKTINGLNILGEGDIEIQGGGGGGSDVSRAYVDQQDNLIRESIPTKTSQLENDSAYVTESDIPAPVDVQINGSSIVKSGAANIPIATKDIAGVVKPYPARGTNMSGSNLGISPATETEMNNRTNYKPVDAHGIDYAVKVALSDGKGSTYSDTEKSNARVRLGVDVELSKKQDTLVSGTNIKTINGEDILGEGDIEIKGGGSDYTAGYGIDITDDIISSTIEEYDDTEIRTDITDLENTVSKIKSVDASGDSYAIKVATEEDLIRIENKINTEYELITHGIVSEEVKTISVPCDISQYKEVFFHFFSNNTNSVTCPYRVGIRTENNKEFWLTYDGVNVNNYVQLFGKISSFITTTEKRNFRVWGEYTVSMVANNTSGWEFNGNINKANVQSFYQSSQEQEFSAFKSVLFTASASNCVLKAGTEYELWGIRK